MASIRIRRLIPISSTPASARRCGVLLRRIWKRAPGDPSGERARAELEHLLMRLMAAGGVRMAARIVDQTQIACQHLTPLERTGTLRAWKLTDPERRVELTIRISSSRVMKTSSVMFRALPPPLTRREEARKRVQDAFYARYTAIARRAYAPGPTPRLSRADRLVVLVGELEADVNNGGFDQYLHNKGRRRANATIAALRRIGAKRTAAMLSKATAQSATPALLSRLDDEFYRVPEDLALFTMRHLERDA